MTAPSSAREARPALSRGLPWAIGSVLAIFGLELLLSATESPQPVALFHVAIVAATWFGGWLWGTVALILSWLLSELFLVRPSLFDVQTAVTLGRGGVFLVAGGLAITATALIQAARIRQARRVAEVAAMAAELKRTSEELARTAARHQRLQEVTAALLRALTPAQVVQVIMDEGVPAAGASMGLVAVTGDTGAHVAASVGCPPLLVEAFRTALSRQEGAVWRALNGEEHWLEEQSLAAELAPAAGESWAVLPLAVRDRKLGALALGFRDLPRFDEEKRTFVTMLAHECGRGLERARLYAAERNARVQAQFAERQVGFLAVASARLSATLDTTRSLAAVADLAVSHLGDFCAIHLVEDGTPPRLVAGSMATPQGVTRFGGNEHCYSLDPQADVGYPAVLRSGRGELLPVVDDAILERAGRTPERIERLEAIGIVTQVCVPLRARDRTLGCITLASRQAGRRFTYADLVLAEELASRVAQSLDNALLYEAAIAASRAKSSFLAVMSHELRTPLNAILGYSDLILLGVPSEIPAETRHQVERIRSAARHLLQIVDDVLNFARIEAGKDRLRVSAVNLDQLVREAADLIRPMADEKGLLLGCQAVTGAVLHTDEGKLMQVLNNLLSNAVKFTPRGRIDIRARTEDDHAVIEVADSGIGIPKEHLHRIFEPFWQVEDSPSRRYGGTGIGLGVARNLTRLLGGDLTVDSTESVGSVFTVRLPLRYEAIPPEH